MGIAQIAVYPPLSNMHRGALFSHPIFSSLFLGRCVTFPILDLLLVLDHLVLDRLIIHNLHPPLALNVLLPKIV